MIKSAAISAQITEKGERPKVVTTLGITFKIIIDNTVGKQVVNIRHEQ
jgi:hypothetical protein